MEAREKQREPSTDVSGLQTVQCDKLTASPSVGPIHARSAEGVGVHIYLSNLELIGGRPASLGGCL